MVFIKPRNITAEAPARWRYTGNLANNRGTEWEYGDIMGINLLWIPYDEYIYIQD